MKKGLVAAVMLTLLLAGGALNTLVAGGQEVRHSPDIGLNLREGALAINALLEWLNASGMNNLSIGLAQAITSGSVSELHQELSRVEGLIENTSALYAMPAEVFKGLKTAEGLNASVAPKDLAFLLLIAYKQALNNNYFEAAEDILKVLNGDELSTEELESVLSEVRMQSNSGRFRRAVSSAINEVLNALRNGTLLNPVEKIEFAAKVAVTHSLLIAVFLQAYKPEKPSSTSTISNEEGAKAKEISETRITPEDIVKAMYILEKFGPKTFFVLKHLPAYRVLMEIAQPNSSALSILKSIPYGSVVNVEGVEGNYSLKELKEIIHIMRNNSVNVGVSKISNLLKISPKLQNEFKYFTNEIEKVTNSTYLSESTSTKELRKTLNSSIVTEALNKNAAITDGDISLILSITSLIAAATAWLVLCQSSSYPLPHAKVGKGLTKRMHPFWAIINKYAEKAGVKLKPSLTHREAYNILTSSAKEKLSDSIAGLIKDLMMIYEFVTYRGDDESLYTHRVKEILRRLGGND